LWIYLAVIKNGGRKRSPTDSSLSDAKDIEAESVVGCLVHDLVREGVESDMPVRGGLSQRTLVSVNIYVCHPGTQNLKWES
jgi:hypothetical protein